jgi:hypothetical protein
MHDMKRLACCGAALALTLGVAADAGAGKPDKPGHPGAKEPKTQACTLDGDATSTECLVGIDPGSFGPLKMDIKQGSELADTFAALGGEGEYEGLGRVLKRQGFLDFTFNLPASECRPLDWDDVMGPGLADEGVCQYLLQVRYGVYDRKGDSVTFGVNSQAWLLDTWLPEQQLISEPGDTASLYFEFE